MAWIKNIGIFPLALPVGFVIGAGEKITCDNVDLAGDTGRMLPALVASGVAEYALDQDPEPAIAAIEPAAPAADPETTAQAKPAVKAKKEG